MERDLEAPLARKFPWRCRRKTDPVNYAVLHSITLQRHKAG